MNTLLIFLRDTPAKQLGGGASSLAQPLKYLAGNGQGAA